LVFKKRPEKKLVDQYVDPYFIEKIISTNAVKLQLLTSIRIHLVVNISIQEIDKRIKDKRSETDRSRRS